LTSMGHLANGVPDGAPGSIFCKTLESWNPSIFAFDRLAHHQDSHGSVDVGHPAGLPGRGELEHTGEQVVTLPTVMHKIFRSASLLGNSLQHSS
jgi:hypothetical protein